MSQAIVFIERPKIFAKIVLTIPVENNRGNLGYSGVIFILCYVLFLCFNYIEILSFNLRE